MYKKHIKKILSIIIAVAMFCSLGVTAFAADDNIKTTKPWIEKKAAQNFTNADAFAYSYDEYNNLFGPVDYDVDGDSVYILNANSNSVYELKNGQTMATTTIDEYNVFSVKLSVEDNIIYLINNDTSLLIIEPDDETKLLNFDNSQINTSLSDFKVINGAIYVTCEGNTYEYLYDGDEIQLAGSVRGNIVDENTYYYTELIAPDENHAFGKSARVHILDAQGVTQDVITVTSNKELPGVQYLGKDTDNNYLFKLYELSQYADGTCEVDESIRTMNTDKNTVCVVGIDDQEYNFVNQTKSIDGNIYQFDCLNNATYIEKLVPKNMIYDSEIIDGDFSIQQMQINSLPVENRVANYEITRERVMTHAGVYLNHTWTCTNANLAAMPNWTKPRFINGAGTYTSIPYCWGGFSNTSQFDTGLSNGGRPGNINSEGFYKSNTYGLDCSGFVSRCWGLSTKYGTTQMSQISSTITMSSLLRGDALNSDSHIRLFYCLDGSGTYQVYEATKYNSYDRVVQTCYSLSDLSGYTPIRYNGIGGL